MNILGLISQLIGIKTLRLTESTWVEQIGREHNSHADILAKLATVLETDL